MRVAAGQAAVAPLASGQAGLPQAENRLYYPALDGLRALAVLLVFASHFIELPEALSWGFTGVDLFFVLSGFLITGILYDSQSKPDRYRVFYMRRVLRIFPLYYAVLLLPVLLYPVFRWQLHPAQWMWPVYLGNYARFLWPADVVRNTSIFEDIQSTTYPAFTYQIPHLWSLCVEEQFYLVWPCVVFAVRDRVRLRNLCLWMVAAIPFCRMLALHLASAEALRNGLLYRATPFRADALLLGGALAMCLRGPEGRRLIEWAGRLLALLSVVFTVLELSAWLRFGHPLQPDNLKLYSAWIYTLLALAAAAIILLALNGRTKLYRVCLHPALRWLGIRSYGFYVYHLLLGRVWMLASIALCFGHRGLAARLLPGVALAGTVLVSWLSFKYLESPMLRLKKHFA
ncbi:MAG: acyltransferase family protein [Janthinobacterium lividum]